SPTWRPPNSPRSAAGSKVSARGWPSLSARWWRRPPTPRSWAGACRTSRRGSPSRAARWPSANARWARCAARSPRSHRPETANANRAGAPGADGTRPKAHPAQLSEERSRLQQEVAALKRDAESTSASERVDDALLREHINDIAAEVARLTMALEGPN